MCRGAGEVDRDVAGLGRQWQVRKVEAGLADRGPAERPWEPGRTRSWPDTGPAPLTDMPVVRFEQS